ncbi:MAG TPA: polyphosphate kinase 2 family protein [Myxococcales bacterium]|jgi:PPK2 family polyphosphate:nucleotide phosphotransferase
MNIDHLRVPWDKKFSLKAQDPNSTDGFKDEEEAAPRLEKSKEKMAELQDKLYAQDSWGVLLIFQAMDAAGKDGTIKSVMSGVNPQGCQVYAFKTPSAEELDHDYMWRFMQRMPERGRIGIFNRSYYEEVLVVKVHPEFLEKQKLPKSCHKDLFKHRYEDINGIEKYLVHNGILPIKFFLHVSYEAQLKRFLKRLDKPSKNWKFSENDVKERARWDDYAEAQEEMLKRTSTKHAPWYVIPADNKWYTRVAVAEVIAKRLEELDLDYPEVSDERKAQLKELRQKLGGDQG